MTDDFITISEAASLAGKSYQAIYALREDEQLVKYFKQVQKGKRTQLKISRAYIEERYLNGHSTTAKQVDKEVESVLREQLDHERKLNADLRRLLDQQQQLTLMAEQRVKLLEAPKRRSFLKRIFNRD